MENENFIEELDKAFLALGIDIIGIFGEDA
jgi:hypothetical protein